MQAPPPLSVLFEVELSVSDYVVGDLHAPHTQLLDPGPKQVHSGVNRGD